MFSLGCIQAMKCGSGKCPTGVTSSEERLISGLDPTDKAARVARYAQRMREDVDVIAHSCGLNDPGGLFLPIPFHSLNCMQFAGIGKGAER